MRNWPVYLLIALAAVGALLMFLSESEPIPTARTIAQAICPTPDAALGREVLVRHLAERVDVTLAEEEQTTLERANLIERLSQLRASYPRCFLDLLNVQVAEGERKGSYLLRGELEYSGSEASDLHAARRDVDATFRASGKDYVLERVELGPVRSAPPEARP
jgi:hypothetical protein